MGPRRLLALVVIVLLALSILSVYTVLGGLLSKPGLYLEFKLYNYNTSNRIIEETGLLSRPDIILFLEATAIAPPTHKEDLVVVHRALYRGSNTIFIPLSKLYDIARGWLEVYKSRGGDPEKTYSGLILRVFIHDARTSKILYELYDSISYKPVDIIRGKSLSYIIHLARSTPKALKVDVFYANPLTPRKLAVEAGFKDVSPMEPICWPDYYVRELVVEVKPEDLKGILPEEYFTSINGKLYVKTPVLIAWNKYDYSGSVGVSINIGRKNAKAGVYPTLTSGSILSNLSNGILPDVPLWKGSGFTWGGENYYYGMSYLLRPNTQWWAWIWARPVFRIYKVYKCGIYVGDDVENLITDILTSGSTIQGGYDYGLPHEALMNDFYKGTNLTLLSIPETALGDGKLDPGESITLDQIFQYYDKCNADFELPIPAGAILARAILAKLHPAGIVAEVIIAFVSAFQISLSHEGASIYIAGNIVNHGDYPGIPGDYNVPEYVYVRTSRYKYHYDIPPPWWCFWCPLTPCDFNVPAGIY
ncbi:MAG: hypothetical protein OWQ48_05855, partial [Desulfurococcus sp.]|nr:hypothetical protein [Desulfurococcus sp.]